MTTATQSRNKHHGVRGRKVNGETGGSWHEGYLDGNGNLVLPKPRVDVADLRASLNAKLVELRELRTTLLRWRDVEDLTGDDESDTIADYEDDVAHVSAEVERLRKQIAEVEAAERAQNPPATDTYGNQLGRGGFARDGRGSALVVTNDPTDLYKTGPKKGRPKLYPYRSASGVALQSDSTALSTWKTQNLLRALAADPGLATRFLDDLGRLDPDSDEGRRVMNAYVAEGDEISEADRAARRGTFAHWLTEQKDDAGTVMGDISDGAALGIDPDTAGRITSGWTQTLEAHGFKPVAIECAIVNDDLRAAGTTDRVVELTRPLEFDLDGERVRLEPGACLILDLKSGKYRPDRNDNPLYWEKYEGQLAAYAGGVPYDQANHERRTWREVGVPQAPDKEFGIIVHADLEALAEGRVSAEDAFRVRMVDLRKGRRLVQASNGLRAAERDAKGAFAEPRVR